MSEASFSFQELREASKVNLANLVSVTASDGVTLSYRCYAACLPPRSGSILPWRWCTQWGRLSTRREWSAIAIRHSGLHA